MNTKWFALAQTLLLAGVAVVILLLGREARRVPERSQASNVRGGRAVGAIQSVMGSALFKASDGIEWQSAKANAAVREEDRLQTRDGSKSIVMLEGKQPVSVAENSMVIFRAADESEEEEVELETGSLDLDSASGGRVRLKSGGLQVRSRPRSVEFLDDVGPLPRDPLQYNEWEIRHAELLIQVAQRLGATAESLQDARRLAESARRSQTERDLQRANEQARQAYASALRPYLGARKSSRAIVSVSRDEKGELRIQALQGEVTILSPIKKVTLKEGEGVRLGANGTPDSKRKLLDPPALTAPRADRTVWNRPQPQLAWQPLAGAVRYTVELSRNREFTDLLYSAKVDQASWTVPADLPDGAYFWRVRAIDSEQFVGMYGTRTFSLGTDHVPPLLDLTVKGAWEERR